MASSSFPHLAKAPIVEAVIDFRVSLPQDTTIETLGALVENLRPDFEKKQEIHVFQAQIVQKPNVPPAHSVQNFGIIGYRLDSADGKNVVQIRLNGFSFSRLAPYTEWTKVRQDAMRLWHRYREMIRPVEVNRLAIRNINRIKLPRPVESIGNHLTAPPAVPLGIDDVNLDSFLTQVLLIDPHTGVRANVIQTIEQVRPGEDIHVILDTDVFIEKSFTPNQEEIGLQFEILHKLKNQIFFNSLKPSTIEFFK